MHHVTEYAYLKTWEYLKILKARSFPDLGTDNFSRQISVHIFVLNSAEAIVYLANFLKQVNCQLS